MDARSLALRLARQIAAGSPPPGARLPSVRQLAREAGCAPGTAARALAVLRDAGVVTGRDRARSLVAAGGPAAAARFGAAPSALRVAGSDDPALDLLLRAAGGAVVCAPGPRGSVTGLELLARGGADAAALHLRHAGTGDWNAPFARAVLGAEPAVLVHLWRREQVLLLAPGNPRGIRGIGDLDGRRLAWRAAGTGSRLLLERLLREEGVRPRPDLGEPADSHLGVAAAVATGAADAGLAVRAVAEGAGLDFLPVAGEPFELALRAADRPAAQPLLDALASAAVCDRVAALPGYDLTETGTTRSLP